MQNSLLFGAIALLVFFWVSEAVRAHRCACERDQARTLLRNLQVELRNLKIVHRGWEALIDELEDSGALTEKLRSIINATFDEVQVRECQTQ